MPELPTAVPAPPGTDGERSILEGFLDQYRTIVVRKATGLDDAAARRSPVPSGTTVAGMVKHLRWVEEAWFSETLAGQPRPAWRDSDPDWQFRVGPEESLTSLINDYQLVCQRSRAIAAEHALEDTGENRRMGTVSLRWIYAHMIEEVARHAGHLDLLREGLDGQVGFD